MPIFHLLYRIIGVKTSYIGFIGFIGDSGRAALIGKKIEDIGAAAAAAAAAGAGAGQVTTEVPLNLGFQR